MLLFRNLQFTKLTFLLYGDTMMKMTWATVIDLNVQLVIKIDTVAGIYLVLICNAPRSIAEKSELFNTMLAQYCDLSKLIYSPVCLMSEVYFIYVLWMYEL